MIKENEIIVYTVYFEISVIVKYVNCACDR